MLGEWKTVFDDFCRKIDQIRRYNGYKYFLGKNKGLENKKFDAVRGPLLAAGFSWPFASKEVWFKGKIVMPEKIAGIPLKGSGAVLVHMAACSSALYVNGQKKIDEQWWINTEVPLANALRPGDAFDLTICYRKTDGNNFYALPQIAISRIESVFLKIDVFFKTIGFLRKMIAAGEIKSEKLIKAYNDIVANLPLGLLRAEKTAEFTDYIAATESTLPPFSSYLKGYCSYLIGHAHIDMNWLWDWENTVATARRTFIQVRKFMDRYPDFHFSQSQAALYKAMEDNYPQVFKDIQAMIKEGRWEVTASTWVEGDLNMASGEALIRQSLYAKEYTRAKFGLESRVGWCPDTFGHAASYPQILKKCGIEYYYFMRCGRDAPVFYWEGIDGSRVLAFNDPAGYNGVIGADLISRFEEYPGKHPVKEHLFSYGVGDHGGGPTIRDIEKGLLLKGKDVFPRVKFSTAHGFFDDLRKARKNIPVITGELNYIFEGCYTTHADIKKYNRQCENRLVIAEIFSSLASVLGFDYPLDKIRRAWQDACFNQFHDLLDGSAIHLAYDHSRRLAERALKTAQAATSAALGHIVSRISYPPLKTNEKAIVIFNPCSWPRDGVAEIDLAEAGRGQALVKDSSGKEIPSQIFGGKLFFRAHNVPALGYQTCFLCRGRTHSAGITETKSSATPETVFENDRYLMEFDPVTAGIKRLFHKARKQELLDGRQQGNIFKLYTELEHGMSGWNIGRISAVKNLLRNTKITGTVKGPLLDIIETECRFGNSRLNQQIIFFKTQDKIEFRTRLAWHEIGTPPTGIPLLRVAFPLRIISAEAVYEIPFGAIARPNNGQEAPALKWLDYSDGALGVALLNDCKYGHNVQGNLVELTVVRSPYEPDLNPDCGEHLFSYCLYPHEGNWQDADVVKRGYEFNMPLVPLVINPADSARTRKILPLEKSFIKVEGKDIIISCLKKAEDGQGLIMHAYESQGRAGRGGFSFGFDVKTAAETDLIEQITAAIGGKDNKLKSVFGKWEIKSYRLTLKKSGNP